MDWAVALVVLVFAIRGLIRGTVRQIFGLLGLVAGLWAAGWVSQWVGAHWQHARPAAVFWVLRWIVAGLAGLALASLFEWCGHLIATAVKAGPFAWLDRVGGFAIGSTLAMLVVSLALVTLLHAPWSDGLRGWASKGRVVRPLMQGGARASEWASPALPRGSWLRDRFLEGARRADRQARAS